MKTLTEAHWPTAGKARISGKPFWAGNKYIRRDHRNAMFVLWHTIQPAINVQTKIIGNKMSGMLRKRGKHLLGRITMRSSYRNKSSTIVRWLLFSQYGRSNGWWGKYGGHLRRQYDLKREHSSSTFCASLFLCSQLGVAGRQEVVWVEKASTSSTCSLWSIPGWPAGARESVSVVTWCFPVTYWTL